MGESKISRGCRDGDVVDLLHSDTRGMVRRDPLASASSTTPLAFYSHLCTFPKSEDSESLEEDAFFTSHPIQHTRPLATPTLACPQDAALLALSNGAFLATDPRCGFSADRPLVRRREIRFFANLR